MLNVFTIILDTIFLRILSLFLKFLCLRLGSGLTTLTQQSFSRGEKKLTDGCRVQYSVPYSLRVRMVSLACAWGRSTVCVSGFVTYTSVNGFSKSCFRLVNWKVIVINRDFFSLFLKEDINSLVPSKPHYGHCNVGNANNRISVKNWSSSFGVQICRITIHIF